jgi:DNA polymerase III sliding clamp (beta) subunit (PCNA family)
MRVSYDSADLRFAVELATRVAPTAKGSAWDKACGMVIRVGSNGATTVEATDLDTASHAEIRATAIEGEQAAWRVSSLFLAQYLAKVDGTIHLHQKDPEARYLTVSSSGARIRLPLIPMGAFPLIPQPTNKPTTDLANVTALADRVTWACLQTDNTNKMSGLHINKEHLVGLHGEAMAIMGVDSGVPEGVTFPAKSILSLVKTSGEVGMSATESHIYLWLDGTDWVSSRLFPGDYLPYEKLRRTNFIGRFMVERPALVAALERINVVTSLDKMALGRMTLTINNEHLRLTSQVKDVGDVEETLDVLEGPETEWSDDFTVDTLLTAVNKADGPTACFDFGFEGDPNKKASLKITDHSTSYEAYIMPRA